MIEGLRVLPFWQQMTADPRDPRRDCETCMKQYDEPQRASMRCGYVPRDPRAPLGLPYGDSDRADTCPGYTTTLPEVVETAENYPQWKERTLPEWLEEQPTRETLHGLAVLANAVSAFERWKLEQDRLKRGQP